MRATTGTTGTNRTGWAPTRQGARGSSRRLPRVVVGDVVALATACIAATASIDDGRGQAVTAAGVGIGAAMLSLARNDLWTGRPAAMRRAELVGIGRAAVCLTAGLAIADRALGSTLSASRLVMAATLTALCLTMWRSARRTYRAVQRSKGHLMTPTVLVGTGPGALDLLRALEVHTDADTRIVGVIGAVDDLRAVGRQDLWLADLSSAAPAIERARPAGVIIATDAITEQQIQQIHGDAGRADRHVVVHVAVPGLGATPMTSGVLAHQPVLHVAPMRRTPRGRSVKRLIDVAVAAVVLVVAAPLLAVVAVVVRMADGGPVLFRQRRVGLHGVPFTMLKLRSMAVDAESRLASVQAQNERTGPLFSARDDPRVTRVGSFLRRTSLDELPQLLNVLRGDMSLVGPRPALPHEVSLFPPELHARHEVRPGITGLWQAEARDNPAFEAYRRLDLHYVHNWSLSLDAIVVLSTVEHLVTRFSRVGRTRGRAGGSTPIEPAAIAA